MEKFLIIMGEMRFVGRAALRSKVDQDPVLGFEYDSLHYEPSKGIAFKIYWGEKENLLDEEIQFVEVYIDAFRFKVWQIGSDGLPAEEVYQDEAVEPYAYCLPPALPEHYWYSSKRGQWDIIYGVNEAGKYIGNVPFTQCAFIADCSPSFDYEMWDEHDQEWFDARDLNEIKLSQKNIMRQTAESAKNSGVVFNGEVYGSTIEDYDSYTDPKLKTAVVQYWDACEERYQTACAEIDAAASIEAVEAVLF